MEALSSLSFCIQTGTDTFQQRKRFVPDFQMELGRAGMIQVCTAVD